MEDQVNLLPNVTNIKDLTNVLGLKAIFVTFGSIHSPSILDPNRSKMLWNLTTQDSMIQHGKILKGDFI